jgi:ATP-independent RNA helicase DbpA
MSESFRNLNLSEALLNNLDTLGYVDMTPVQAAALPVALLGRDILGQAKTGSGKTAVFGLTLLQSLKPGTLVTQGLILCPTRELSLQVATEMRRLARCIPNVKITPVYGGQALSLQKQSLKHGTHIVVGTPGRIRDLLEKDVLHLGEIRTLVLDEADRMLEMGFQEDLALIVRATPATRQTLLFSATYPPNIEELGRRFQKDPLRVQVDSRHKAGDMDQQIYRCPPLLKAEGVKKLLLQVQPVSALVFCNQKQGARDLAEQLNGQGIAALALHGDLEQQEREEVLFRFAHQSCTVLVATDVAARGLDIKELPLVINLDLPSDPEIYVHRMGRTGRAGHKGRVVSFCSDAEAAKWEAIARYQSLEIPWQPIATLRPARATLTPPPNVTLCIACGRKDKIRPGEILGTLTAADGLAGDDVGKIDVTDYATYVAVSSGATRMALKKLNTSKIKGRSFRVRLLGENLDISRRFRG